MTLASRVVAAFPRELIEFLDLLAGAALAISTLGGTILLSVALLVATCLRRSSASVRHRIWGQTLVALLALPYLSVALLNLPHWNLPVVPAMVIEAAQSNVLPTNERHESTAQIVARAKSKSQPATTKKSTLDIKDPAPRKLESAQSFRPGFERLTYSSLARMIWLFGAVLLLAGVLIGAFQTTILSRQAQVLTDSSTGKLVEELRSQLQLRRPVQLLEHPDDVIPMTWGFWRPVLLLPRQARQWSEPLRRAVVLHELAHIQRGDVAFQLLGRMACAVYWFHPLAWWALHRLRVEREFACDDAVVQAGERASDYAEQLLEVARKCRGPYRLALAVGMIRGGSLEQRLRMLFDSARSHMPLNRRWSLALLAGILLLTGSVAVVRPAHWKGLSAFKATSSNRVIVTKGPLTHRVHVVGVHGEPVAGAKLIQLGFGTARGSGMRWLENWPAEFQTNSEGMAVISIPDVSDVDAHQGGIASLNFTVIHPDYAVKHVSVRKLDDTYEIRLYPGVRLTIRAIREGIERPLTADLFLYTSGYGTQRPATLVDGILRSPPLDAYDPTGGRYLRVIHAPAKEAAWFSELIDLKQHLDNGGTAQLDVTLHPGVRVEGKLADEVARPVIKGTICANILDGSTNGNVNEPRWSWADIASVHVDGTFVFESLPRETNLQLIAVCDGWASHSPTSAEVEEYCQTYGLQGGNFIGPQIRHSGRVLASLIRLTGPVVQPVLAMQRTMTCNVTAVDTSGKPLEGARVTFSPNQCWLNGGSTLLGYGYSSLEQLRTNNSSLVWSQRLKEVTTRLATHTDRNGHGSVSGLPAGTLRAEAELANYERVSDSKSEVASGDPLRMLQVEVRPGETASTRITLRRKN